MKAIFKLNNAQISTATAMTAEVADAICYDKENDLDPWVECGVYLLDDQQYTNLNQSVRLVGKTLVIEGERCALAHDGGFKAAIEILGTADAVPAVYQTSDKRLFWHETLDGYIYTRGNDAERVDYLRSRAWQLEPRDSLALELVLEKPRLAYAKLDEDYIAALLRYKKTQKWLFDAQQRTAC